MLFPRANFNESLVYRCNTPVRRATTTGAGSVWRDSAPFPFSITDYSRLHVAYSHFPQSHNYADSISVVGSCAFVQTGVIGATSTRDGFRHSRLLRLDTAGARGCIIPSMCAFLRSTWHEPCWLAPSGLNQLQPMTFWHQPSLAFWLAVAFQRMVSFSLHRRVPAVQCGSRGRQPAS